MRSKVITTIIFSILTTFILAQADSQWRGPNRDGKYPNETLLKSWPEGGPTLVANIQGLGQGYSQPAVTDKRIYVTGMLGEEGHLFAFDSAGKALWNKPYGKEWTSDYPGSRVTPTVVGDLIYLVSTSGIIHCFNANGDQVWSLNMQEKFNAPNIRWGITESLLVDGDRLFCTPGAPEASIATLDRHTGKILKTVKINGQASTYCSPVIFTHHSKRILVTMLAKSVVGIDADNMTPLFEAEHITSWDINPNTPVYQDGYLYIVSGYGTGGELFQLSADGTKLTSIWAKPDLDSQIGAAIVKNGHIYGSGHKNRNWKCIDFKTGDVTFDSRELGRKGNIIFSDGMLYIYSEKGDVALVRPNPDKLDVVSSFTLTAGSGEHWAHLVIHNGRLYVRHGDILNIYDISR